MAALTPQVNASSPAAYCQRLENFDLATLLRIGQGSGVLDIDSTESALGVSNGSVQQQALCMALRGCTEFEVAAQTETNDTVTSFNLSDKGVTFPAGTLRRIEVDAYITADADAGVLRRVAIVAGGTTPLVAQTKLKGIEDAATATSEGGIRYSVAAGDFLGSSLILPDVGIEQNTNKIRLTFTGTTNLDMFWTIKVKVFPLITQTFPVTD